MLKLILMRDIAVFSSLTLWKEYINDCISLCPIITDSIFADAVTLPF